jgi:hypothetical protein
MTTPESHWRAVGDRVEALGQKLRTHLAQTDTTDLSDALDHLGRSVREAFDAAGSAVRDETVRSDVREVGRLLADAVSATFHRARADVREVIADHRELRDGSGDGSGDDRAEPGPPG